MEKNRICAVFTDRQCFMLFYLEYCLLLFHTIKVLYYDYYLINIYNEYISVKAITIKFLVKLR